MRAPFTAGLLIGCLWGAQSVYTGSFEFTPLRANLSQQTSTEVITVKNNGDAAVVVQLQVLQWAMDGDRDVYTDSDEVLATPPIFTLPVAASQVVRVGLTQPVDARREQTYRLFFEEVPPPPEPGYQGLRVALRVGLPIFVAPGSQLPAHPQLNWRALRSGQKEVKLRVTNIGNAHSQIIVLALRPTAGASALAEIKAPGYILAGQAREWVVRLPHGLPGKSIHLSAQTDGGPLEADVALEAQ
ncbi:MAG: fimbrial biogenesis chaperone [Burkholderiales bacterium]